METLAAEYIVRTMRGASEISRLLRELSQEGWEPVNFARDAAGEYEVILRREEPGDHQQAVLEQLENAVGPLDAPDLPDSPFGNPGMR